MLSTAAENLPKLSQSSSSSSLTLKEKSPVTSRDVKLPRPKHLKVKYTIYRFSIFLMAGVKVILKLSLIYQSI